MNDLSFATMGMDALRRQQYDAAINMLRQAIGDNDTDVNVHYGLARALHEKGYITQALSEYRLVLQSDGGHEACLYHIARALLQNGDPRGAMNNINQALSNNPLDPDLLSLRAKILLALEKPDMALTTAQTASHNKPGSEEIHLLIAACYRAIGDLEGEAAANEQLLRIHPASSAGFNDQGLLFLYDGKLISAFECFEQALSFDPDNHCAFLNRAITMTIMGDMDDHTIWKHVEETCESDTKCAKAKKLADRLSLMPPNQRKRSPMSKELMALALHNDLKI